MDADEPSPNQSNLPATRTRHDGWTAERQAAFLKALAACGCVREACRAVGMSHVSAYALRARPSAVAFRAAWEAAIDCAMGALEDAALSRAINGVARPIIRDGEQVGEWRHHDERLTMFLLRYRRPVRYSFVPDYPPPLRPPGLDPFGAQPDPDEAMGRLDWHLDELEDDRAAAEPERAHARAHEGGNFGNFADPGAPAAAGPVIADDA